MEKLRIFIKLLETMSWYQAIKSCQLLKIKQSGGFPGRRLVLLLKTGLTLMKNVLQPLAKSSLISSGLTAAALTVDERIYKKILGLRTTSITRSSEEMQHVMKLVKSLKDSGLLVISGSEITPNEPWE